MKIALVAAATQGVSRRKGAKQSPGDPPGEDVLRPVRGHALGCAWSPKAHLERLLGPFLPLTALIPLPASVPASECLALPLPRHTHHLMLLELHSRNMRATGPGVVGPILQI